MPAATRLAAVAAIAIAAAVLCSQRSAADASDGVVADDRSEARGEGSWPGDLDGQSIVVVEERLGELEGILGPFTAILDAFIDAAADDDEAGRARLGAIVDLLSVGLFDRAVLDEYVLLRRLDKEDEWEELRYEKRNCRPISWSTSGPPGECCDVYIGGEYIGFECCVTFGNRKSCDFVPAS